MGTISHHSLIITDSMQKIINELHQLALELFNYSMVSEISYAPVDQYYSFCIFPDGSKEWWTESDKYNSLREKFLMRAQQLQTYWVLVEYGELGVKVLDSYEKRDDDEYENDTRTET